MIKKVLSFAMSTKTLEQIRSLRHQLKNFKLLANDYGQWITIRDWNAVDRSGKPIPWYTYPTTEFLSHLDLSNFKVFEYGSGNSTLWWSHNAGQVTSVEDDETWFNTIRSSLNAQNVNCFFEKDAIKYSAMASNGFDIFIVDGKHRRACLEHVVNLKGGVMIILGSGLIV